MQQWGAQPHGAWQRCLPQLGALGRTCIAELLVEAIFQVQLWGPGLDGLL